VAWRDIRQATRPWRAGEAVRLEPFPGVRRTTAERPGRGPDGL